MKEYFPRSPEEHKTLQAWPLLHPYFYYFDYPDLFALMRSKDKDRELLKRAVERFYDNEKFKIAKERHKMVITAIVTKSEEILAKKGLIKKDDEDNQKDSKKSHIEKLFLDERVARILDLISITKPEQPLFTLSEEDELNNVFYQQAKSYLGIALPPIEPFVESSEINDENVIEKNNKQQYFNLYSYWSNIADQLFTIYMPSEVLGGEQPFELPQDIRGELPYKLVLLAAQSGTTGFAAGRKLALMEIGINISHLFSNREVVNISETLDTGIQRQITALFNLFVHEGILESEKGIAKEKEIKVTSYLDPQNNYKSQVASYQNLHGETETVFSLSDGNELIVKSSIEDLLIEFQDLISALDTSLNGDDFFWHNALDKFFNFEPVKQGMVSCLKRLERKQIMMAEEGASALIVKEVIGLLVGCQKNGVLVKNESLEKWRLLRLLPDNDLIYARWDAREKRVFAFILKVLRRGYSKVEHVEDPIGASWTYLNLDDADRATKVIERTMRRYFELYDERDDLINVSESDAERDSQMSDEARFKTYKARLKPKYSGGILKRNLPVELQEHTFLSPEHGIGSAAHWRYRLRQYFANLLRILFPPEFYGERFKISDHLKKIRLYFQDEAIDGEAITKAYDRDSAEFKKEFLTDEFPYHDKVEYQQEIYIPALILSKLYHYSAENDEISGLLTLETEELKGHPIEEAIISLKEVLKILRTRFKIALNLILSNTDRSAKNWRKHEKEIFEIVEEACVDFIVDFLQPVSQEDGG